VAVAVDADAGVGAVLADGGVAVTPEVRVRTADLIASTLRRHGLADVELVSGLACVRVALARDVAVVTEADAARSTDILNTVGRANEVWLLVGHATTVDAHETTGASVARTALVIAVPFDAEAAVALSRGAASARHRTRRWIARAVAVRVARVAVWARLGCATR